MFQMRTNFLNVSRVSVRASSFGCVTLISLMLAACGLTEKNSAYTSFYALRGPITHPIDVVEGMEYIEILLRKGVDTLSLIERQELIAFLGAYKNDAAKDRTKSLSLVVRVPSKVSDEGAAHAIVESIRGLISGQNIPLSMVSFVTYEVDGETVLGDVPVVLTYKAIKATVLGGCGGFTGRTGSDSDLRNEMNSIRDDYGCSTSRNLAAMLDNPTDLLYPRQMTPASASRQTNVYSNYVRGQATASSAELKGGKVSGVGQ